MKPKKYCEFMKDAKCPICGEKLEEAGNYFEAVLGVYPAKCGNHEKDVIVDIYGNYNGTWLKFVMVMSVIFAFVYIVTLSVC